MKQNAILFFTLVIAFSCQQKNNREKEGHLRTNEYEQILTNEYQLYKPKAKPKAVLILFGGYPEVAEDILREFKILEAAKKKDIAIIYSNYNKKLWFEEDELNELATHLKDIFNNNSLPNDNIHFGGFSSGGDVALLIGNFLKENAKVELAPKGIFIVDSPIDLAQLYFSSEKNIKRGFSEVSIQESNWLIGTLGSKFGNPHTDLSEYEKHSVFTLKTRSIDNLMQLKNTKIRLYTEPDTVWWKENRLADYEQTNAYLIQQLSGELTASGFTDVEYIPTKNRGYRANGERHPHSWSIVEVDGLISWILDEKKASLQWHYKLTKN